MHVFISYAHEDVEFAENVRHELEKGGLAVWIDELTPIGDDWRQDIEDALRAAFALVLIVTPASTQSLYVTYEWSFALGAGVLVLPVLRAETEFHPRIDRAQYLDFTNLRHRPWATLIKRLTDERDRRQVAVPSLPRLDGEQIIEALRSRQADTRAAAIKMLRRVNDPAALPLLEGVLFPEEAQVRYTPEIRKAAMEALGNLGETALPVLIRCLSHSDKNVRFDVGPKLIALGDAAVPDLLRVLEEGGTEARVRVTWVLGDIGSPDAVPALIAHLEDRDHTPTYRKRVSDGAADALIAIGTPAARRAAAAYWEAHLTSKRKHWGKDVPLSDYAAERLLLADTPEAHRAVARWREQSDKDLI